jgi:hypothetical protein
MIRPQKLRQSDKRRTRAARVAVHPLFSEKRQTHHPDVQIKTTQRVAPKFSQ